jgi:hypothetical protein
MSTTFYTIRYRSKLYHDKASLIIEDDKGKRFHFTCHPDHCTLLPLLDEFVTDQDLGRLGWQRVEDAEPYPLDALRALLKGAVITRHLPPALVGTVHAA